MIRKMAGSNEFRIFIALLCFFSFLLPFTIFVFFFSAICVNQTTHPLISHALSLSSSHTWANQPPLGPRLSSLYHPGGWQQVPYDLHGGVSTCLGRVSVLCLLLFLCVDLSFIEPDTVKRGIHLSIISLNPALSVFVLVKSYSKRSICLRQGGSTWFGGLRLQVLLSHWTFRK